MNRSVLQIAGFVLALAVLWFLFPLLMRFIEGGAMHAIRFWWVILLFVFVGLFLWSRRRR